MTAKNWTKLSVLAIAAVVVLILMFQSTGEMKLLFWEHTKTWIALLVAALAGFVAGMVASTYRFGGKRRKPGTGE